MGWLLSQDYYPAIARQILHEEVNCRDLPHRLPLPQPLFIQQKCGRFSHDIYHSESQIHLMVSGYPIQPSCAWVRDTLGSTPSPENFHHNPQISTVFVYSRSRPKTDGVIERCSDTQLWQLWLIPVHERGFQSFVLHLPPAIIHRHDLSLIEKSLIHDEFTEMRAGHILVIISKNFTIDARPVSRFRDEIGDRMRIRLYLISNDSDWSKEENGSWIVSFDGLLLIARLNDL
jgi:hypothetical protein